MFAEFRSQADPKMSMVMAKEAWPHQCDPSGMFETTINFYSQPYSQVTSVSTLLCNYKLAAKYLFTSLMLLAPLELAIQILHFVLHHPDQHTWPRSNVLLQCLSLQDLYPLPLGSASFLFRSINNNGSVRPRVCVHHKWTNIKSRGSDVVCLSSTSQACDLSSQSRVPQEPFFSRFSVDQQNFVLLLSLDR